MFRPIAHAITEIAAGRMIMLIDEESRGEAHLVFSAEMASPHALAFAVRHSSGLVYVPLAAGIADRLDLPLMRQANQNPRQAAYTVTVDAREGVSTGISAADRAHTIRVLADPTSSPTDLSRPGHVVPLRGHEGGVCARPRPTEAAIDLMTLAGLRPVAVLCMLVSERRPAEIMSAGDEATAFAASNGLALVTISDLVAHQQRFGGFLRRGPSVQVRLPAGAFTATRYSDQKGREHVALLFGDIGDGRHVRLYLHLECVFGDTFGSLDCDCHDNLQHALSDLAQGDSGMLLYLSGAPPRRDPQHASSATSWRNPVRDDMTMPEWPDADALGITAGILTDLGARSVRLPEGSQSTASGLAKLGVKSSLEVSGRTV